MAKHDRAKWEKQLRNLAYANKHRQRECRKCKHRSSRPGRCAICGGEMKGKGKENSGST